MKAFPHKVYLETTDPTVQNPAINAGMDLRDYFAAKALPALISDYLHDMDWSKDNPYEHFSVATKVAYVIADDMMKERSL